MSCVRLIWLAAVCACASPGDDGTTEPPIQCAGVGSGDVLAAEPADGTWPKLGDIALDADHVYWTNFEGRALRRVAKVGGTVENLAVVNAPLLLALDSTTIYVLEGTGTLDTVPSGGGAVTPISRVLCTNYPYPCGWGLAVDGQTVYWGTRQSLQQQPVAGGDVSAVDWPGNHARDVLLDDDHLYVARSLFVDGMMHALVERIAKVGGEVQPVIDMTTSTNVFTAFALDADHVYASQTVGGTAGTGTIWRARKDGSEVVDLAVPGSNAMVVDGGYLYVARGQSIERIPVFGGAVETVACEPKMSVGRLAIDAERLYWIDGHAPGIRTIAKPQ